MPSMVLISVSRSRLPVLSKAALIIYIAVYVVSAEYVGSLPYLFTNASTNLLLISVGG